ncbi:MAG: hypothetical protein J1E63_00950 [Muribaculaceae bacterium]|nr:hypothetical protein [Muribaculaceae bacterium]
MKSFLLLFALIGILSIPAASAFTSAQFAAKKCWKTLRLSTSYLGGQNIPLTIEGDITVSNSSTSPNPYNK